MNPRLGRLLGQEPPTPLDDWTVTIILLAARLEYRQRVVDEIALQTEGLYRLRRSVQMDPLGPVLESAGIRTVKGEQRAILPLALMPKAALLEFDVTGPGGEDAFFVSRIETANRQLDLIRELAVLSGVPLPPQLSALVYGLSLFTPGMLDAAKREHEGDRPAQVAYALRVAYDRPFDRDRIERWQAALQPAAKVLQRALGAPADLESSSENVLLALIDGPLDELSDDDVEELVTDYCAWVAQLDTVGATSVLWWLATFGRRYFALVDTLIDPEHPALLKVTERRPLQMEHSREPGWLGIPWGRHRAEIDLETKEGRSYHLRVRSADDSVWLHGVPEIRAENGEEINTDEIVAATTSTDGYAIYLSKPSRPGHARIVLRLRLSDDIRRALLLVGALAGLAALAAVAPVHLDKAALSLITLPATFSATLLLVRERTTLSAKILARYKRTLVLVIILLWLAALGRVTGFYDPGTPPDAADEATATQSASPTPTPSPTAAASSRPTRAPSARPTPGRTPARSQAPVPTPTRSAPSPQP
jgi:hypothetical protein